MVRSAPFFIHAFIRGVVFACAHPLCNRARLLSYLRASHIHPTPVRTLYADAGRVYKIKLIWYYF